MKWIPTTERKPPDDYLKCIYANDLTNIHFDNKSSYGCYNYWLDIDYNKLEDVEKRIKEIIRYMIEKNRCFFEDNANIRDCLFHSGKVFYMLVALQKEIDKNYQEEVPQKVLE
jgi:hypothetical protein